MTGSVATIGGRPTPPGTFCDMPSAVRTTVDGGDGSGNGGGVVNTRITYCPGGTIRNVNAPLTSVTLLAVVIDSARLDEISAATSSSRAGTRPIARCETGPSGPVTTPDTRNVRVNVGRRSTPSRSSPACTDTADASAAVAADGYHTVGYVSITLPSPVMGPAFDVCSSRSPTLTIGKPWIRSFATPIEPLARRSVSKPAGER